MAAAVFEAAETGRHLLVQAGTGTGKSLAYLVPAIERAVAGDGPVVISTATLALQAQIVDRDLPRVAAALAPVLGRYPTWQLVKGRANYVCVNKLAGGFPAEDEMLFDFGAETVGGVSGVASGAAGGASRLGQEVVRLREWAAGTTTGDRDELVPGVSERAWRQVAVTASECFGQRCPMATECHSESARTRAREVDLIVTNHAFVSIDAFEGRHMLPEHDLLIIDEAHELADRVTSVISDELTSAMITAAGRRARRAGSVVPPMLDDAAAQLEAALESVSDGRVRIGWPDAVVACLAVIRDAAREQSSSMKPDPGGAGADGGRQLARAAMTEISSVAERLIDAVGPDADGQDVAWVSRFRRNDGQTRVSLHVAPLSVAIRLREKVFTDRTVVLTSATLALGGSFEAAAGSVGLVGKDAPAWDGLDVGSPFDYGKQGILYVAKHLPPPGRDGVSPAIFDELAALITAAGGRTLGLFSSRRAAETAAEELRSRLDLPILCQGDDATPTLVRAFARDTRTCLFGTLSLWQGVDVPGSACQLVVIDRIPFPRPDDPLASARQEAVAKAGGNGFLSVAGNQAALLLAQGAGRLIRATADRGVVAVLDSRLATARYGSYLTRSMPGFWATSDRAAVFAALERIDHTAPEILAVHEPERIVAPAVAKAVVPDVVEDLDVVAALDVVIEPQAALLFTDPAETVMDLRDLTPRPPVPSPESSRSGVALGRGWTSDEDEELTDAVGDDVDVETLADHFDCTPEQILARCTALGLKAPELL
jgi:ATP-dependent DNA helicase DinG